MNLFKLAYKLRRENSNEIYRGFGFRHLSDATAYYVHPNNQSYNGTTTLCQSIGEALVLFCLLLEKMTTGKGGAQGEIYTAKDQSCICLDIHIPQDWHEEGIVEKFVDRYRIFVRGMEIYFGAYDANQKFLPGDMTYPLPLYKFLACFAGLLAWEIHSSEDMRSMMLNYISQPSADSFVNLHEDFYQRHKNDEYKVSYEDVMGASLDRFTAFSGEFLVIRSNKEALKQVMDTDISAFETENFETAYQRYIPCLPSEFVLPPGLSGVCNAVKNADALSVLLHGPSGTGKTISCKLICQAIGLPIMETVNCTENLDEFVLGKYIPQEDRIVFQESYVTKAIRFGGAVVFEEINFAKPQYLAFLNSLLDDNGFVRLDNGEVVTRHPRFRFFATMNLGYFGTKELNQSLYNRFNMIIEVSELSDQAIRRMLLARVPQCQNVVGKLLGVYHKLKKRIEAEELDLVISPRNLENWAKLAKYEGYLQAAEKTMIPIAKCDRTMEEAIRGIILLYKWV